jgi:HAD superfamily hydrolase (TIGR01549 family)
VTTAPPADAAPLSGALPTRLPRDLRALIFDLDGTLYDQRPVHRALRLALLRENLLSPLRVWSTLKILRSYREALERLREMPSASDLAREQVRLATRGCGRKEEEVQACVEYWTARALDFMPRAQYAGIIELLAALRSRGIRTAVLSDYPAETKLARMGLRAHFDVVLWAGDPEVRALKPSPRGLHAILARLGVPPKQALYVGDRPEVDAAAAQAAGVACAILNSPPRPGKPWWEIASFEQLRDAVRHI